MLTSSATADTVSPSRTTKPQISKYLFTDVLSTHSLGKFSRAFGALRNGFNDSAVIVAVTGMKYVFAFRLNKCTGF